MQNCHVLYNYGEDSSPWAEFLPNASAQPLPKAGAQRTLEAVGCSALFGSDGTALRGLQQFLDPRTRHRNGVLGLQAAGDTGRVFLVVRVPQHPVNSR
jgi:hypothetical protein